MVMSAFLQRRPCVATMYRYPPPRV